MDPPFSNTKYMYRREHYWVAVGSIERGLRVVLGRTLHNSGK